MESLLSGLGMAATLLWMHGLSTCWIEALLAAGHSMQASQAAQFLPSSGHQRGACAECAG